jgi:hypothetical protein
VPAPYDTQGGTRKVFSTAIPGAQQLVLDWEHALYCRADTTPDPCGIARMIDPSEHASFVFNILQHVNSDHRLTPAASRVAFWLTHHANRETHMCWPSIPRLAKLSRLSNKAVRLAIQSLEVAGYIEVDRTSGKHHVYTLLEQEKWDLKRFMKRNGKKYRTTPVKSTAGPRYNLPPNHLSEHLELNARIAEAMPAQIKQAKKRMEEELSDWIADSLVDEREESQNLNGRRGDIGPLRCGPRLQRGGGGCLCRDPVGGAPPFRSSREGDVSCELINRSMGPFGRKPLLASLPRGEAKL